MYINIQCTCIISKTSDLSCISKLHRHLMVFSFFNFYQIKVETYGGSGGGRPCYFPWDNYFVDSYTCDIWQRHALWCEVDQHRSWGWCKGKQCF